MSEILNRVTEENEPKLVSRSILDSLDTAELNERAPSRIAGRHARAQMFLGLLIDMKSNLFLKSALERVPSSQQPKTIPARA
jgi:hypothetical protein